MTASELLSPNTAAWQWFELTAIAVIAKVTVLLIVAALIAVALRRSSAAVRHHVWLVGVGASLMIPLLAVLPGPAVNVPERWLPASWVAPLRNANANTPKLSVTSRDMSSAASRAVQPNNSHTTLPQHDSAAIGRASLASISSGAATSTSEQFELLPNTTPTTGDLASVRVWTTRQRVIATLAALWLAGFAALLLWRAAGFMLLSRMLRRCSTVCDETWLNTLRETKRQSAISRSVHLCASDMVRSPITAGWLSPVIVLPTNAHSYPVQRQRAVLAHELAHIARADYFTQNFAALVTAIFWFHPLIWIAAAQMRSESERAADDCVLQSGMRADKYAEHLLALADRSHLLTSSAMPAIGMARISQLEARLRAMLNQRASRRTLSVRVQRVAGSASLMMIVPFATAQIQVTPIPSGTANARANDQNFNIEAMPSEAVAQNALTQSALTRNAVTPEAVTPRTVAQLDGASSTQVARAREHLAAMMQRVTKAIATQGIALNRGNIAPRAQQPPTAARDFRIPGGATDTAQAGKRYAFWTLNGKATADTTLPQTTHTDTTFEQNIDAKSGELLTITVWSGANVVVHGWDQPTARLRATLGGKYWRETRVLLRRDANGLNLFSIAEINGTTVTITDSGSRIRVRGQNSLYSDRLAPAASTPSSIDHQFELWVPKHTNIKLESHGGSLRIEDLQGDFAGTTKRGDIDILRSNGTADLHTPQGDVNVAMSELKGSITTLCGLKKLNQVSGSLNTTARFDLPGVTDPIRRGPLLIIDGIPSEEYCTLKPRMSDRPGVDENWPYGNIVIDSAPNGGQLSTNSGFIKLGSSGGVISAIARKGDIELRAVKGDATAIANEGNVLIRIVNANGVTQHFVSARTSKGNIVIDIPDGLDAVVDAEAAYTESFLKEFGHEPTISGEHLQARSELGASEAGDDMQARKFVRAFGKFGNGSGRITIRAVNGNITLRRSPP